MSDKLKFISVDGSTLDKTEIVPIQFNSDAEKHAYIMNFLTGNQDLLLKMTNMKKYYLSCLCCRLD